MKSLGILIGCIVLLTGCKTNIPLEGRHSANYQMKVQAAEHWRRMAQEISAEMQNDTDLQGHAIYLHVREDASAFDVSFARLIKANLLKSGWKIAETTNDARLRFTFQSMIIEHGDRDLRCNARTGEGSKGTRRDLLLTAFVHDLDEPVFGDSKIVYVPLSDFELYMAKSELAQYRADVAQAAEDEKIQRHRKEVLRGSGPSWKAVEHDARLLLGLEDF